MAISRICHPQLLQVGQSVELRSSASLHVIQVLRLKIHDKLILFDNSGFEYDATLTNIHKKTATATIHHQKRLQQPSKNPVFLGQCISRGERMDFIIQKVTELGVHTIVPLFSRRCNVKLEGSRLENRLRHWQEVAISASEQSGRCIIPSILEPLPLTQWIDQAPGKKFICELNSKAHIQSYTHPENAISLLIGPEGGLDDEEISQAKQKDFQSLSLGPRVLRTETAAIVAMALVQSYWGDQ